MVTRNGLGIVELQDQLKHYDPNVTALYGQASLTQQLVDERTSWSEDMYEELISGYQSLIGGGASEIFDARKIFNGLTRSDKRKFLVSLPKSTVVDQVDIGLCLYRADRAVCGGNKNNCMPADCSNSVIIFDSAKKILDFRKAENERLMKLFKKSDFRRTHLLNEIKTINRLLAQGHLNFSTSND